MKLWLLWDYEYHDCSEPDCHFDSLDLVSIHTTEERAVKEFEERHGRPPKRYSDGGIWEGFLREVETFET
jgi:hypothetical protein